VGARLAVTREETRRKGHLDDAPYSQGAPTGRPCGDHRSGRCCRCLHVGDPNPDPETIVTTQTETRTQTETTTTVEAITGLGADVIEDLLDLGAITEVVPVEPEDGWDTERSSPSRGT
jgi:hypothetical protein